MFNSAVATLNAPPVSIVLNWKSSYDGANGALIDMSQAVPGYSAHPDILAALATGASDPALARYGPVEGDPGFRRFTMPKLIAMKCKSPRAVIRPLSQPCWRSRGMATVS
jgi:hypothetical protein